MKRKEVFKTVILIGILLLNIVAGASAYDPFVKPKPTVNQTENEKNKSIKNLPPPEPIYKTMWVLPMYNSSRFRVLGKVGNEYIVLNTDSNKVFFWKEGKILNHCVVINGEVECYVKKKVRVR